jgi:hypothetical protein
MGPLAFSRHPPLVGAPLPRFLFEVGRHCQGRRFSGSGEEVSRGAAENAESGRRSEDGFPVGRVSARGGGATVQKSKEIPFQLYKGCALSSFVKTHCFALADANTWLHTK